MDQICPPVSDIGTPKAEIQGSVQHLNLDTSVLTVKGAKSVPQ